MGIQEYKRKINDAECSAKHLLSIIEPYNNEIFNVRNSSLTRSIWQCVIHVICRVYNSLFLGTSYYSNIYNELHHNFNPCENPKNIADYYLSKMSTSDVRYFMLTIRKNIRYVRTQCVPYYTGTNQFLLYDILCHIEKSRLVYESTVLDNITPYRYGISLRDICKYANTDSKDISIQLPIKRNKWLLELFPDKKEYTKFIVALRCIFRFSADNNYYLRTMNICTIGAYKPILIRILQVLLNDGIMINKNAAVLNKQRNNNIKGLKISKHCVIIHDLKHDDKVKRIPRIMRDNSKCRVHMKHIFIGPNEIHYRYKLSCVYTTSRMDNTKRCELVPNIKTDNSLYSIKNPMQTPTDVQIREMATIIMLDMMTIRKNIIHEILDKHINKLSTPW